MNLRIPYLGTRDQPRSQLAEQAVTEMIPEARAEIDALEELTRLGCTATPKLLAWKQDTQPPNSTRMPVPGGYVVFILMEKCPGICLDEIDLFMEMSQEERDELRHEFKLAWLYVLSV